MKRIIITSALTVLLGISATAQSLTAKALFVNPEPLFQVCQMISHSTRQDLVDYCEAHYTNYNALDIMGDKCSLDTISDNYLCVQLSASTTEIALFNTDQKKPEKIIIVEVSTLNKPVKDSIVRFYNGKMQPLESKKFIKLPTIADFITIPKGDNTTVEEVADIVDMQFISCTFSNDATVLTFTQHAKEHLSKEDYAKVGKYLNDTVVRKWTGKRFE